MYNRNIFNSVVIRKLIVTNGVPTMHLHASILAKSKYEFMNSLRKYHTTRLAYCKPLSMNGEPPRLVDTEGVMKENEMMFPYLDEDTRIDIWTKHKSNPEEWTAEKLSQHFSTSMERTNAILYLMKEREELMRTDGLLSEGGKPPALWKEIFRKHAAIVRAEDKKMRAEKLAAMGIDPESDDDDDDDDLHDDDDNDEDDEDGTDIIDENDEEGEYGSTKNSKEPYIDPAEVLPNPDLIVKCAEEYGISEADVKNIIDKMSRHKLRLQRVATFHEQTLDFIWEADVMGYDVSFRETPDNKVDRLEGRYFPTMIQDDGAEAARVALMRRIEKETKAKAELKVSTLLISGEPAPSVLRSEDQIRGPVVASAVGGDGALTEEECISRFKIAFRDTSPSARAANRPTMIRTRAGRWRPATPLEELNRTWVSVPCSSICFIAVY